MLCGVVRGFCRDKEWCHWQGFVTRSGEDQKSREIARALIKECCPDHTNTIVSDTHDNKSLARRIGRVFTRSGQQLVIYQACYGATGREFAELASGVDVLCFVPGLAQQKSSMDRP